MTTSITPVAKHTGNGITRAVDGERAGMDSGPAPLKDTLQVLADRAQYARGATWGNMVGGDIFAVDSGGTNAVFTARVSAFEVLVAQDTNGVFWPRYSTADTTFTAADIEGGGSLANSTWYYCYLGMNTDGSLRKQISATGPGASRVWKSGAADVWRYVGCFRTNGSGAPLPVRAIRGQNRYRRSAIAGATLQVLSAGSATGFTDVALSSLVPPHARVARLELLTNNAHASNIHTGQVRTKGDTTNTTLLAAQPAGGFDRMPAEIETDSSQVVQYLVSHADANLTIDVLGFEE